MTRTVVGLYEGLGAAQEAVRDLVNNGFRRDDISLVAKDGETQHVPGLPDKSTIAASQGAGAGAILGGLAGLLVGLGALAIPGIGPIIAAGPIAATLAGAGVGAVAGGLAGALIDAGVPQGDAQEYADGVRRGGTLVIVRTTNIQAGAASALLERHGAAKLARHESGWEQDREADHVGRMANQEPVTELPDAPYATSPLDMDDRIGPAPADEEEDRPTLRANLTSEAAPAESEPFMPGDRAIDRAAGMLHEGPADDRAAVGEAGQGGREPLTRPQPGWNTAREYDAYADEFRKHYEMTYARPSAAAGYERYEPAYRYGYELGGSEGQRVRERPRKWSEVEPEARQEWERRYPNEPWDNFREAVRSGWERAAAAAAGGVSPGGENAGWAGPDGRLDRPSYQGPEDRRV